MSRSRHELHRSFRPCRDFLLATLPMLALATYFYGLRPFVIVLIASLTALLCDVLNAAMRHTPYDPSDISSISFAVIFSLMLPAAISYWVVIFGSAFTVLLGKHAFGGYENYPFHPAAFGLAVVSVCWPAQVFKYTKPFTMLPLSFTTGNMAAYDASAHALHFNGLPYVEISDLLTGNFIGPIATTFGLVIMATLALLVAHHAMTAHVSLSFIAVSAAFALIFPRIPSGRIESLLYELFSSAVLFSAVFLAGEPSASPKSTGGKVVFGASAGLLTMLFRYYGQYDFGACFALLLIGPLSGYLDRKLHTRIRRRETIVITEDSADA